jgi:hypothetical protein
MLGPVWTVSYTVFGMDCTEQDPVTNFRVTRRHLCYGYGLMFGVMLQV